MAKNVGDVADAARGQLSHIEYLLNIYSDNIYSPDIRALVDILENVHTRLGRVQTDVASMINAYTLEEEPATHRNTTSKLHSKEQSR